MSTAINEEGAPNHETIIVPGAEDPTLVALKEGYQAAFFPDADHKTNPYLGTGKVDLAWAWLEGFHYGTHCVALQNEVTRLKLEVDNLKTYLGDALPVAPIPSNLSASTCAVCKRERVPLIDGECVDCCH